MDACEVSRDVSDVSRQEGSNIGSNNDSGYPALRSSNMVWSMRLTRLAAGCSDSIVLKVLFMCSSGPYNIVVMLGNCQKMALVCPT